MSALYWCQMINLVKPGQSTRCTLSTNNTMSHCTTFLYYRKCIFSSDSLRREMTIWQMVSVHVYVSTIGNFSYAREIKLLIVLASMIEIRNTLLFTPRRTFAYCTSGLKVTSYSPTMGQPYGSMPIPLQRRRCSIVHRLTPLLRRIDCSRQPGVPRLDEFFMQGVSGAEPAMHHCKLSV